MWLELLAQVEELYVSHSSLLLFYLEKKNVGSGEGGRWLRGFGSLIRRKQVDSVHVRRHGQLARKLSAVDLVGIGNYCSIPQPPRKKEKNYTNDCH